MEQRLQLVEGWIKTVELRNNEKLPALERQVEDNRSKLRSRQKEIEKAVETHMRAADEQSSELKRLREELEELKKGSVERQQEMMTIGGDVSHMRSALECMGEGAKRDGQRVGAVETEVENLKKRVVAMASSTPSSTPIARTATTSTHSRSSHSTGSGTVGPKLHWTQKLSKMSFEDINVFGELFKDYCSVTGLSPPEERLILMRSLEGAVLKHAAALPASLTAKEILERLLDRLKPTQAGAWVKLLKIRQRNGENLNDYIVRFMTAADLLQSAWLNEEQKIEIFLESLVRHWCVTAKGLKRTMPGTSFEDFVRELSSLESPDAMDIDVARAYEETEQTVNFVRRGGQCTASKRKGSGRWEDLFREYNEHWKTHGCGQRSNEKQPQRSCWHETLPGEFGSRDECETNSTPQSSQSNLGSESYGFGHP